MRLVIKNSIQLCLRTLVFSIVLRHSNYNNGTISIVSLFFGTPCTTNVLKPCHYSLLGLTACITECRLLDVFDKHRIEPHLLCKGLDNIERCEPEHSVMLLEIFTNCCLRLHTLQFVGHSAHSQVSMFIVNDD